MEKKVNQSILRPSLFKIKKSLVILFLLGSLISNSQSNSFNCKVHNFFYSDSANGEQAICQNQPSALLTFPDGSVMVSSILSVRFLNQNKSSTSTKDNEYWTKQKNYRDKSHISSGTLFKLDNNFNKQWELLFKEERIVDIHHSSNSNVLVFGERTDRSRVWVACVSLNGIILWKTYHKKGQNSGISDVFVDSVENSIYILLESQRLIPFKISRNTNKKIHLFKTSEKNDLYLTKLDVQGKLKWIKTVDKRRNVEVYGQQIQPYKTQILISYSHIGPEVDLNNSLIQGKKLITLDRKGKIKSRENFNKKTLLPSTNGTLYCTSHGKDTLSIYKNGALLKSHLLPADIDYFWIRDARFVNNQFVLLGHIDHNLGNLLIGLNQDFEISWYWTNNGKKESSATDFTIDKKNNDILLLSESRKYSNSQHSSHIAIYQIIKKCVKYL